MIGVLTVIHVLLCVVLIAIILLQAGKGAEMGAVFGGSSQTLFGSRGAATFLSKVTTVCAVGFMVTSLTLVYLGSRETERTLMKAAPVAPPPVEAAQPPTPPTAEPVPAAEPAPTDAPAPAK